MSQIQTNQANEDEFNRKVDNLNQVISKLESEKQELEANLDLLRKSQNFEDDKIRIMQQEIDSWKVKYEDYAKQIECNSGNTESRTVEVCDNQQMDTESNGKYFFVLFKVPQMINTS